MSDERARLIREQRNSLLSNLQTIYPGSLAGEDMFRVMLGWFPDYTRTFCFRDLYYLEEKGYVVRKGPDGRIDAKKRTDWKEARWTLTAAGNEVANNLIDDPALEV